MSCFAGFLTFAAGFTQQITIKAPREQRLDDPNRVIGLAGPSMLDELVDHLIDVRRSQVTDIALVYDLRHKRAPVAHCGLRVTGACRIIEHG